MLSSDNIRSFLNQKTDYLINWNRVGNLFFSNHRYSTRELVERGFVITCTAAGGFLTWNKSEEGGVTPFALGASLAFLLSHSVIISPLIYKRLKAKWSCDEHIRTINSKLNDEDKDFAQLVKQVIDKITTHAAEKSPSAIWGKRDRLMKNLETWIDEEDHGMLGDILKNEEIISLLDKGSFPETESLMIKSL
ncbi:hypothetical protein [Legionella longbeachae]|uniref:Uncharacterized protein n=1 Tax=Legionella longbeachae serogroup 1 (strain NSW150) TaxID=661367 RepID=D3HME9_LEGLN|nr:hypothetical protein [Legionella longbeachae]HBD7396918.1 hypothetical protein [Legionella pneumophila]ARM33846.2 hypothetical protein B0B39_10035 [Legionella longbeachae]QEY52895.1 hypothetical protein FQU71_17615 [Legionella longbeachae]QIN33709.1 hypothetical protein GCB94_16920 [Legionella longbeachae]QIN37059.1 hypothetical protein GCS73_16195 [Legionella longbeachae]